MLKRYGNLDYVLHLGLNDGLAQVDFAREKDDEDRLFLLYSTKYMWMDKKSYVPFESFFRATPKPSISRTPKNEVLEKAADINRKLNERRS